MARKENIPYIMEEAVKLASNCPNTNNF